VTSILSFFFGKFKISYPWLIISLYLEEVSNVLTFNIIILM